MKSSINSGHNKIIEGKRNDALASHLGALRQRGCGLSELEAEALRFSNTQFSPPLPEAEALKVAHSIFSYPSLFESVADASSADAAIIAKLVKLQPEEGSRYKNTEQGWGYLFADMFKDEARYCPERKAWFVFDGKRWKYDVASLMVGERAKKLADALYVYLLRIPDTRRTSLRSGWEKWQRRGTRDTILRDAASVYPISLYEFDADLFSLNVSNGTLNLNTGKLQPHSASDFITKIAPVIYDPEVSFHRWEQFISEIMNGDEDVALFLQHCLGYALSGSTEHEKMFILYGVTSRNGKSTLIEAVSRVLGDYAATADPEMLSTNRNTAGGMKPTEDLAKLDGARFVSVSEPPRGMPFNSAKLKQWTGSDKVKARYLNENSFEYLPQFKMYLNTNDLPGATDTALFNSGRMVVIPFNRHFTETEQDHTLKQQFAREDAMSAILNWLLDGWLHLQAEGLKPPLSVLSAIHEYSEESNIVKRFVEECLEVEAGDGIKVSTLLRDFNTWAHANGLEGSNHNTFKGELQRAGYVVNRSRPKDGGNPASLLKGYKSKTTSINPF